MDLSILKDVLIILLLGFAIVLLIVGIRLVCTFQKTIRNIDSKTDSIKDAFIETKDSITSTLSNTKPTIDILLKTVDDTKSEVITTLEHLNEMIDEAKTLTSKFNNEASELFDTINNIGMPLKNAVDIVSKPISSTSRFANAAGKAFTAFKEKLTNKKNKEEQVD